MSVGQDQDYGCEITQDLTSYENAFENIVRNNPYRLKMLVKLPKQRSNNSARRTNEHNDESVSDGWSWSDNCNHGISSSPVQERRAWLFINAYWDYLQPNFGRHFPTAIGSDAFNYANKRHPKVLNVLSNLQFLKAHFIAIGTEIVLKKVAYNKMWLEVAGCVVSAVLIFDKYEDDPSMSLQAVTPTLLTVVRGDVVFRTLDTIEGCEKSIVRFFRHRSSCSCLEQRFAEAESHLTRTGMCHNCLERKESNTFFVCQGCRRVQFCSLECHVKCWPNHKPMCRAARS